MKVQINIRGRVFHIRTDDDPQQLQEISEELNHRLDDLSPKGKAVDEYAILVITALSLLGELRQNKDGQKKKISELEHRVELLLQLVDQGLHDLEPNTSSNN